MQAETDHSDVEIRINALKDELKRRMMTAAKLKRQQRAKSKEKLRMQEDALKRQIEKYDKLIQETKEELLDDTLHSSSSQQVVQPQIKTPKQSTTQEKRRMSADEGKSVAAMSGTSEVEEEFSSLPTVSIDSSVEMASPVAVKDEVKVKVADEIKTIARQISSDAQEQSDLNYSDDFTSSASESAKVESVVEKKEEAVAVEKAKSGEVTVTPKATEKPKDQETLAEEITTHILNSMIAEACTEYKSLSSSLGSPSVKETKATPPPSSSASPRSLSRGSPGSRPQDLMHTTFDISPESSDEGTFLIEAHSKHVFKYSIFRTSSAFVM